MSVITGKNVKQKRSGEVQREVQKREQSKDWYKAGENSSLSLPLLTHCPRFFSLFLSASSILYVLWSKLPVWPGFWSQHITSHFVSHSSQLQELAARLCTHPVAEGISKHCLEAKETQNNRAIWFLGENAVRIGGNLYTHTHIFPPFCHLGTHHSGFKVGRLK